MKKAEDTRKKNNKKLQDFARQAISGPKKTEAYQEAEKLCNELGLDPDILGAEDQDVSMLMWGFNYDALAKLSLVRSTLNWRNNEGDTINDYEMKAFIETINDVFNLCLAATRLQERTA